MITQYKELISHGLSITLIAKELNISKSTVQRNLKKFNLKTENGRLTSLGPISKETLELHIQTGESSYTIATILNRSRGSVVHWMKKYNLHTQPNVIVKNDGKSYKKCPQCQIEKELCDTNFYLRKNRPGFHGWCKECNNSITIEKQRDRKKQMIDYKGGKCCKCGYDKYIGALEFHHLDPTQKDFNLGQLKSYSLEAIKPELDKCICVCANCHREIHGGVI